MRKNGVEAWTAELPLVQALFTTRRGGYSQSPFHSMNLSPTTGDDPDLVRRNLGKFMDAWGGKFSRVWYLSQVHSKTVIDTATVDRRGLGVMKVGQGDGLISAYPGDMLITFHADCAPIYLVDPERKVIGLGHAGWRGTGLDMGGALVRAMMAGYGSDPEAMMAAVGPSISRCCYEVDRMVVDELRSLPYLDRVISQWGKRWRLDLEQAQVESLVQSGVPRERIYASRLCTSCRTADFYSHRRDGSLTGRMVAALGLVG